MPIPLDSYRVRSMTVRDIPQVMVVNRQCFPVPWSAWTIEQDITNNRYSAWVVVEQLLSGESSRSRWWDWWRGTVKPIGQVIGFGGFWILYGEMHITNIGVATHYRGQGWGEVLLASMLQQAIHLQADYATLEVRVSNQPAINLYHKYEYRIVVQQRDYYHDNHEDAHSMATRPFDWAYQQLLTGQLARLHHRLTWTDELNRKVYA